MKGIKFFLLGVERLWGGGELVVIRLSFTELFFFVFIIDRIEFFRGLCGIIRTVGVEMVRLFWVFRNLLIWVNKLWLKFKLIIVYRWLE